MKADNTEIVAQGMEYSKCKSLGGKSSSTTPKPKVTARASTKPQETKLKPANLPLSCQVITASSVKAGLAFSPKISVKNNTTMEKVITITGDVGDGRKGGSIAGFIKVPAKRTVIYTASSAFIASAGSPSVKISAKATSPALREAVCTKTIKIVKPTTTQRNTTAI